MPYTNIWTKKLQNSINQVNSARGVFVGYNACIDFLEYLDHQSLEQIYLNEISSDVLFNSLQKDYPEKIENTDDFLISLIKSISSGKAKQIPTYNSEKMIKWFNRVFEEADEHRMGGQSGIIANLLGKLGVSTIVYIPNLSHVQARRFYKQNILFPVINEDLGPITLRNITKCGQENVLTKINWIFEFEEGLSFPIEKLSEFITAPRSNRLIIADRPKGLVPGFSDELEFYLPELGSLVERAILSGYQYLTDDNVDFWLDREQKLLRKFVSRNPNLRLHLEFASISNEKVRKAIIDKLRLHVHSLGCNEVELRAILHDLGEYDIEKAILEKESVETLYEGVNRVKEILDIPRLHLHTLSYHIIFIDPNYCANVTLDSIQNAALYSSLIGTAKTLIGEFSSKNIKEFEIKLATQFPISYNGIKALEQIATKLKKEGEITNIKEYLSNGIIKEKKTWKLVIPTQLTPAYQMKSTVGLGDSISSTAFIFDCKD
ncbi:MAG: Bifunctional ADP-specific glucokinase/phosphofructokinase [Candidatus Heimdallarchaeota archaeon LC_3]|nr:MAG: Bifunctional ADP-specific glucokinase/phosphofructokinase [Candidatus Heimdallarchaeota archaeon LC_3]